MGEVTEIDKLLSHIANLACAGHQRIIAERIRGIAQESTDGNVTRALTKVAKDLLAELADQPPTTVIVGRDGCIFSTGSREDCQGEMADLQEYSPDMIEDRGLRIEPAPWDGVQVDDVVKALARPAA